MSENIDRDNLIRLLERLGEEGDDEALAAAREIHKTVSEAGIDWDDLLSRPTEEEDAAFDDDEDSDEVEDEDNEEQVPAAEAGKALNDAQAGAVIDKLLAKSDLYEGTREELEGYKEDIAEGEFTKDDRRYIQALQARLTKKR